jgi:hypothetical protein
MGWRGTHAFEPPVSPVLSTEPMETVTLVPFGSQHMRISWFPFLGNPEPACGAFEEKFDASWSGRWTVFGGNWIARAGELRTAPASANGAKALEMATAFTNFTYEGDVSVGPVGDAGLVFRVSKPDIGADAYCGYYAGINSEGSKLVVGYADNAWHELKSVPMKFSANTLCHLKVMANGPHIRVFAGESPQPVADISDDHFASGMIGVRDYCTEEKQSLSAFSNLVAREMP